VKRAVFLTVLHRLFESSSDRSCERWRRDCAVGGTEALSLHHTYRAMAFLGEPLEDQSGATSFSPRCVKDLVEEGLFAAHRDLFTGLDLAGETGNSLDFRWDFSMPRLPGSAYANGLSKATRRVRFVLFGLAGGRGDNDGSSPPFD